MEYDSEILAETTMKNEASSIMKPVDKRVSVGQSVRSWAPRSFFQISETESSLATHIKLSSD